MDLILSHIETNRVAPSSELLQLLAKAKKNDRRAQGEIYRRYHGKWMGLCLRYFKNRDDALEALNHGFLKIFKNLKKYDVTKSFDGWGYRIVQNTAIDYARKNVRKRQWDPVDDYTSEVSINPEVLKSLEAQDLLQLLHQLPESTRLVFNLFALEGYKHHEISKMLSISEGTSKWHVSNARKLLQRLLENTK